LLNKSGGCRPIKASVLMANVHTNPNSNLTLAGYCARVAFAIVVIVIGLKIAVDHFPCEFLPKGTCTPR